MADFDVALLACVGGHVEMHVEIPSNTPEATRCILCGSADMTRVAVRGSLDVYRCPKCELLTGGERLTASSDDDAAVATNPGHFQLTLNQYETHRAILADLVARRMPHYRRMIGRDPINWLEIGPGNGALSDVLADRGAHWLGIEIDPAMAAHMSASGKNVIQADFSCVDVDTITPKSIADPGGFDIVFFTQVLEHVVHPSRFLANALACLKPGGVLHLDVPNGDGLTAVLRRLEFWSNSYAEIVPPYHMISYGKRALTYALSRGGFEDIEVFSCDYADATFGLAHARITENWKLRAVWGLSKALHMGGNLVALARKAHVSS